MKYKPKYKFGLFYHVKYENINLSDIDTRYIIDCHIYLKIVKEKILMV